MARRLLGPEGPIGMFDQGNAFDSQRVQVLIITIITPVPAGKYITPYWWSVCLHANSLLWLILQSIARIQLSNNQENN